MLSMLIATLVMFQIKHLVIDFYLQDMNQVRGKGIFGNPAGISHSLDHLIGTMIVCFFMFNFISVPILFFVSAIDGLTHYAIDYCKMNFGNRDMMNEKFWHHLGLDQFAHQIVYLSLTAILFSKFI